MNKNHENKIYYSGISDCFVVLAVTGNIEIINQLDVNPDLLKFILEKIWKIFCRYATCLFLNFAGNELSKWLPTY